MPQITWGLVKDGVVVPQQPLPEGILVQIVLHDAPLEFTPEEQAEFDAWSRLGANALELVERLANEGDANAEG